MLATLASLRKKYGSVEQYMVDACRLSLDDVAQIRQNLIVDGEPLDWESHARLLA